MSDSNSQNEFVLDYVELEFDQEVISVFASSSSTTSSSSRSSCVQRGVNPAHSETIDDVDEAPNSEHTISVEKICQDLTSKPIVQ